MRSLAKHETRWSFLLIVGNLKDTILHQRLVDLDIIRKEYRPNFPPKRHVTLLTFVFVMARDRCQSKKNQSISNRTSRLTSNNFRRTNEQFVQLYARHLKITNFLCLIKCGIVMRL